MPKIYEMKTEQDGDNLIHIVFVKRPDGTLAEEIVSESLYDELKVMQREIWRLEKREQRHCVHLDAIPEYHLPSDRNCDTPESKLLARLQSVEIYHAFSQLTQKQQRRFVLRYIYDLPISVIAKSEGCSERAVKYSIKLARRNLIDILGEGYIST